MFELPIEIHVHLQMLVWVGKEAGYDVIVIGLVIFAELRQYWLSCSVSAEFVTQMIRTAFAIYILYYL